MKIRYLNNRRISINIKGYITEAAQELGEDVSQLVMSLAERCHFAVGKVGGLQGKRLNDFHSVVMKLLWIFQRGRPYCATDISFLCASMKHPDVEY